MFKRLLNMQANPVHALFMQETVIALVIHT
jgi:hypothetical protein